MKTLDYRISVVVIARNERSELRRTVENLEDTIPDCGEIVVVDDGSKDKSADYLVRRRGRVRLKRTHNLGVGKARNFGANHARGGIIVFADAHIRLGSCWWQPLVEALDERRTGAVAPAITHLRGNFRNGYGLTLTGPDLEVSWLPRKSAGPFASPILPGCCLAMRRDVFEAIGGWDEGLLQRGGLDNELCLRMWLLGYQLLISPAVVVRHLFRTRSPYPVGWPEYLHNKLRLAFVHLSPKRLGKVVVALRKHEKFGQALALVVRGNISERREEMMARRVRDDDWYFHRFGLRW